MKLPWLILALILLLPYISLADEAKEAESKLGIFTSKDLGNYFIQLLEEDLKREFDEEQAAEVAQLKQQIGQIERGGLEDGSGLMEPYIYLKGKFPQQRLQDEIQEIQNLFEEATDGAPLPNFWLLNYQATQQAEAEPELLILMFRFGSMLRQQVATQIEATQTAR